MSARGVSSRRAIEQLAMEGNPEGDPEMAPETAQEINTAAATDMELAEERGAERLRARLREMLDDRRRIVRLGEQQIEVVEVSAVEDVLGEGTEESS
jgi:hypothetical protein